MAGTANKTVRKAPAGAGPGRKPAGKPPKGSRAAPGSGKAAGRRRSDEARFVTDAEGKILYATKNFAALSGFSANEKTAVGLQISDLLDFSEPDDALRAQNMFAAGTPCYIDGIVEGTHEVTMAGQSGAKKPKQSGGLLFRFDKIAVPDGRRFLVGSQVADIEEKASQSDFAETILRLVEPPAVHPASKKSTTAKDGAARKITAHTDEGELRQFLNMSNDLMAISTIDGKFSRVNSTFNAVLGYADAELRQMTFIDLVYPDDRSSVRTTLQSLIRQDTADDQIIDFETRVRGASGGIHWMEWRQKRSGNVIYSVGRDVTAIKNHETALRSQAAQLSEAQSIGHMGHWHWTVGSEGIEWSDEIYNIFGVSKKDFAPTLEAINSLLHKRDIGRLMQAFQRAIIEQNHYEMEFRAIRPGGEVRYIRCDSGSTGNPKGVVLKFRQYAAAATANRSVIGLRPDDRTVSYLPLAHITERTVIQGTSLYAGGPVYFVESLDTFVDDLKVAQPTAFLSVPRLWVRFQAGVHEKMPEQKLQKLLRIPLLGKIVARKIRQGLGLNSVRIFGSGSAPISPSTLHWYYRLGIPICEAWGMTETAGLSTTNMPFREDRLGTIGVPIDCLEIRLSDKGEMQVRGDTVFETYYKNPEATADSFEDGWFKTGDKAIKNPDGSYTIVGRLKEEFKTAKGKYVAPVPIESQLAGNPDIEQVCLMGSGRTQPVAVVVLAEHLRQSAREPLRASLQHTLSAVNAGLESHQRLDGILVADDLWSIENGLLTPTLKLKRADLEKQYQDRLANVTAGKVFWEDETVTE